MKGEKMQDLRKAAQQALEALQIWQDSLTDPSAMPGWRFAVVGEKAIANLRAALAEDAMQRLTDVQQEMEATSQESRQVEPVAWISYESLGRLKNGGNSRGAVPVHTIQSHTAKIPLYTAPPKRKPLTDWEIEVWAQKPISRIALCRAIERAHGIGGEE